MAELHSNPYFSIKKSDGTYTSVATDSNNVEVYTISLTSDFNTEWFDVDKTSPIISIDVICSGIVGSGTLTWQHSRNKSAVYPLVTVSNTTASLTLNGSTTNDYLVSANFPLGFHRLNWSKGTVSAGTIQILVKK